FSSRRRHTRWPRDWSSDVCSSDLLAVEVVHPDLEAIHLLRRQLGDLSARIFGIVGLARDVPDLLRGMAVNGGETAPRGEQTSRRSEERRVGKEWRYRMSPCH